MGKPYSAQEDSALAAMWQTWTRPEIMDAMPGRSWSGIEHRARALGLKRDRSKSVVQAASEKGNAVRWQDKECVQTVIIRPAPAHDAWVQRAVEHRTALEEAWR